MMIAGALVTGGGVFWLSHIPVHDSYLSDLLPGMILVAIGIGPMFVAITTAANAGVPPDKAGLSAPLVTSSQQLGGASGLAIFIALAASRTHHLIATHTPGPQATVSGFQRGLLAGSIFLLAAAVIALRCTNARGHAGAATSI
jgi:hypothetical protein